MVLMTVYPAPPEFFEKLLDFLGDPDYAEITVLLKTKRSYKIAGIELDVENPIVKIKVPPKSEYLKAIYKEYVGEYERKIGKEKEYIIHSIFVEWNSEEMSVKFDGFDLNIAIYIPNEKVFEFLKLIETAPISCKVDVGVTR